MSDEAAEKSLWDVMGVEPVRVFRWKGKEYPVREATLEESLVFCEWLASSALAAVESQSQLAPAARNELRSLWMDMKAAGHWSFLSPAYIAAVAEPSSQAKLVSIVLTADGHPECTHEFCKRMVVAEIEDKVREALAADPKAMTEVRAMLSLLLGRTGGTGTGATGAESGPPSPGASGR